MPATITRPADETPDLGSVWLDILAGLEDRYPGITAFALTGALPEPAR